MSQTAAKKRKRTHRECKKDKKLARERGWERGPKQKEKHVQRPGEDFDGP